MRRMVGSFDSARVLRARLGLLLAPMLAVAVDTAAAETKSARTLFEEARVAEKKLNGSEELRASKSTWLRVARRYRRVVVSHPQSGYSDDALYFEAELYRQVDQRFGDRDAARRAVDAYTLLVDGYPASKWCRQARLARADLYADRLGDEEAARKQLQELLSLWPKSQEAAEAQKLLGRLTGEPAAADRQLVTVRNIRHWTGKEYTRIVIDVDEEIRYQQGRLGNPDRIYFDLFGTHLSTSLATRTFPIEDGFLRQIRTAQNTPEIVRIVLDFESISRYNVFSLHDPYRLVVDILGIRPEEPQVSPPTSGPSLSPPLGSPPAAEAVQPMPSAEQTGQPPSSSPPPPSTLATGTTPEVATDAVSKPTTGVPEPEDAVAVGMAATTEALLPLPPEPTADGRYPLSRQLGLAARRLIIDPGHGGQDPGTISRAGLQEKDLVLDISRRVAKVLESAGEFEVLMTRETDIFIPLEERTAIANSKSADLFISIHANASRNRRARGIETYYLNLATSPEAEETAARENAVTSRRMGELQAIVRQIMNNSRIAESGAFAQIVHESLADGLLERGGARFRDLGVKTAPFYVLLGANMPSVLVEVSFLSNQEDARLLSRSEYRQRIAESIARGIQSYTSSLKKTARGPTDSEKRKANPGNKTSRHR